MTTISHVTSVIRNYTWAAAPATWGGDQRAWAEQEAINHTLAIGETVSFAELVANTLGLNKSEAWSTAEAIGKTFGKAVAEAWSSAEDVGKNLPAHQFVTESITFSESVSNALSKGFSESWTTADSAARTIELNPHEGVAFAEGFARVVTYFRSIAESWITAELSSKSLSKALVDAWSTTDSQKKVIGLNPQEAWATADVMVRTITFNIAISEGFSVAEAISKAASISPQEIFQIVEQYVRRANAVFSDLKIKNFELTDDAFEEILLFDGPVGYENFKPFIAGDYQFQKAAFRYILRSNTSDRPRVTALTVNADVPDIYDRGTASISAGSTYTFVPFNRTFTSTTGLEVTVTLKGGTVFAIPRIQSGTTTVSGFYCRLEESDGVTFPAGTISWTAQGY